MRFLLFWSGAKKSCFVGTSLEAPKIRKVGPRCGQGASRRERVMKEGERGMISIAVGNIPAPGLGKLGAVQICCHAEISVKYNLRIGRLRRSGVTTLRTKCKGCKNQRCLNDYGDNGRGRADELPLYCEACERCKRTIVLLLHESIAFNLRLDDHRNPS